MVETEVRCGLEFGFAQHSFYSFKSIQTQGSRFG
jgi:hypothetical protein